MSHIYRCKGKHFKVYHNSLKKVLEHPSDTEEVDLNFYHDETKLIISVSNYIEQDMRKDGQRNRLDIYIEQDVFIPILKIIKTTLAPESSLPQTKWRYSAPIARDQRQGVPNLIKLAELQECISAIVSYSSKSVQFTKASMVIDSEVPGQNQTKWLKEGGGRQIHLGVFSATWEDRKNQNEAFTDVYIHIPKKYLLHNFVIPIEENLKKHDMI